MGIGHEGVRYVLTHFLELGTVCATDNVKSTKTINLAYAGILHMANNETLE
jgi:hypothetical protein